VEGRGKRGELILLKGTKQSIVGGVLAKKSLKKMVYTKRERGRGEKK